MSHACLAAVLLLGACDRPHKAPPAGLGGPAVQALSPFEVRVPPAMARRFRAEPLAVSHIAPQLEVTGLIEANPRQVARIGSAVTGRVAEVLVEVGDRVRAGQVLARIASQGLTEAQLDYLRAHAASQLAESAVERARQLIAADVIGTAELQRRETELTIARAEQRAAGDHLRLIGIPESAIAQLRDKGTLQSRAQVLARQAGIVIERNVSAGQVVRPGDPLFTVADLGNVWVVGSIPEQLAQGVHEGQRVEIVVPALGGKSLSGRIVHVGDTVSPRTRTVALRTQVDNPRHALKPQMLATMRIEGDTRELLAVPVEAVVREDGRDHVFVQKGENHYLLTPVELGAASGGLRPVLQGLSEGTLVVTQGAFHLNNERQARGTGVSP